MRSLARSKTPSILAVNRGPNVTHSEIAMVLVAAATQQVSFDYQSRPREATFSFC